MRGNRLAEYEYAGREDACQMWKALDTKGGEQTQSDRSAISRRTRYTCTIGIVERRLLFRPKYIAVYTNAVGKEPLLLSLQEVEVKLRTATSVKEEAIPDTITPNGQAGQELKLYSPNHESRSSDANIDQ